MPSYRCMNNKEVRILLNKYRSGTLNDEERAILESWYLSGVKNAYGDISDEELRSNLELVEQVVMARTKPLQPLKVWVSVAAAAFVLIGVGLFFVKSGVREEESVKEQVIQDVAPGSNKATLTLASGETIGLSSDKNGIIIGGGDIRYADGTKVIDKVNRNTDKEQTTHNSITTPKGGQYQAVLPDGTRVWLNAASTLAYPSRFRTDRREVLLSGEAYFEVINSRNLADGTVEKKGSQPFVVKSGGQEILVLGTSFNVSAYPDELVSTTTLVQGAVKVSVTDGLQTSGSAANTQSTLLKPGQEAILSGLGLVARQADIQAATSWKDGVFRFNESELRSVMKQISRWYNVEVEYRGFVPETYFYGVISRNRSLSAVLDVLKEGGVHFKIEQTNATNKLVVLP